MLKTVVFTGHRPEKLPWGTNEDEPDAVLFKSRLHAALEYLIGLGYVNYMSGAARGFDSIAAETVIDLRREYPWVQLIVALPCTNQAERWSDADRARWEHIVRNADRVDVLAQYYDRGCMFRRNRYLVNHSDMVLAAYDGSHSGGTAMTVDYARQRGVKVRRIAPAKQLVST